jgi:hypothetical protein
MMWKCWVVRAELQSKKDRVITMKRLSKEATGELEQVQLPFERRFEFGDKETLMERLLDFADTPTWGSIFIKSGYWTRESFDALSISLDGTLTIFQSTIGKEYTVEASALDFILNAISEARKHAVTEASISILNDLFPSTMRKWRLVFCVPERVEDDWKHPMAIGMDQVQDNKCSWDML